MIKQFAYIFKLSVLVFLGGQMVCAKSLWTRSLHDERGMFADRKASARGDILTVMVSENYQANTTLTTETEKDSEITNKVTQFLFSTTASNFGTHAGELPSTDITGENTYTSEGTNRSTRTLTDRFSVMVIDRLPNKNLVLEGVRVMATQGQTQFVVFRGIVRSYDIDENNMVESSKIADARLEYIDEGMLTEAQKIGWLQRINNIANPF